MSAVVAEVSADQARDLTDRIKVAVEGTWHLIKQAYEARAWTALGYSSWDEYCTREFGTSRLKVPREDRTEVVASLRGSGLSLRAIASATGLDRKTVRKEIKVNVVDEVGEKGPPAPRLTPVTGTDGKTYTPRSQPQAKPQRSPLPKAALSAGWELRKAVERVEKITKDDRFSANKEQIAAHLNAQLAYAVEVCADLHGKLDKVTSP